MKKKFRVVLELLVDTEAWSPPSEWDWSEILDLECDAEEGDIKVVSVETTD